MMLAKVLGALCAVFLARAAVAAEPLRADVVPSAAPQEVQLLERRFAPGESSGWHIHHGVEMTYVVSGEMRLSIAGQPPRALHAGDSFKIDRDTPHEAVNTGAVEAVLIVTYLIDKGGPAKVPVPPPK
jgi:quercetin dioxygenase-like cupin family protein